jgi:hypothetical protein
MTPRDSSTTNYDNLAPRRNSTRNIQTSENAEASGTMIAQNPSNWRLPPPDWGTVEGFRR